MAKLMEIINKNQNLKNGTITLKFLDTTFTQLTRKLGSLSGANYKTLKANDILSKEALVSLNQEQLLFKPKLLKWKDLYNAYLEILRRKGIPGLIDFEYNFSSLIDYSSKYEPGKTLVDYYMLQEFVNAEKEMYEFGHFWGRNHIKQTANKLKEWSKKRNYGSAVGTVETWWEAGKRIHCLELYEKDGYAKKGTSFESYSIAEDKMGVRVWNLQKIEIGETAIIEGKFNIKNKKTEPYHIVYLSITISRKSLGNMTHDDGYFIISGGRNPRIKDYTGNGSTHFDFDSKDKLLLNYLKTRIIR